MANTTTTERMCAEHGNEYRSGARWEYDATRKGRTFADVCDAE